MPRHSDQLSQLKSHLSPVPAHWFDVSKCKVLLPASSKVQTLPLGEMPWENFQGLCLSLARGHYSELDWWIYGEQGHKQDGVDLLGMPRTRGKYVVMQCKRVKRFSPASLKSVVQLFVRSTLAAHSKEYVLCVTRKLNHPRMLREICRQRVLMWTKRRIKLAVWDATQITRLLKTRPKIVEDFFLSGWVNAFCIGGKDPSEVQAAREQILRIFRLRGKPLASKIEQSMQLLRSLEFSSEDMDGRINPLYVDHTLDMDYRNGESRKNLVSTHIVNLSSVPVRSDWDEEWGTTAIDNSQLRLQAFSTKRARIIASVSHEESTPTRKKFWFTFDPPLAPGRSLPLKYEFFWAGHHVLPGSRWHEFLVDAPVTQLTLVLRSKSVSFGNVLEYSGVETRVLTSDEYGIVHANDSHRLTIFTPTYGKKYSIQFTVTQT